MTRRAFLLLCALVHVTIVTFYLVAFLGDGCHTSKVVNATEVYHRNNVTLCRYVTMSQHAIYIIDDCNKSVISYSEDHECDLIASTVMLVAAITTSLDLLIIAAIVLTAIGWECTKDDYVELMD